MTGCKRRFWVSAPKLLPTARRLKVRTGVSAADKQYGVLVDYTWASDGYSLALRTQVRPQESGARSGVRSAALVVSGYKLEISGEPFALTVRPYSMGVLDAATHRPELLPDGRTYVYLDHVLRWVGTGACGPGVLDSCRLNPREADFTVVLRVNGEASGM